METVFGEVFNKVFSKLRIKCYSVAKYFVSTAVVVFIVLLKEK